MSEALEFLLDTSPFEQKLNEAEEQLRDFDSSLEKVLKKEQPLPETEEIRNTKETVEKEILLPKTPEEEKIKTAPSFPEPIVPNLSLTEIRPEFSVPEQPVPEERIKLPDFDRESLLPEKEPIPFRNTERSERTEILLNEILLILKEIRDFRQKEATEAERENPDPIVSVEYL